MLSNYCLLNISSPINASVFPVYFFIHRPSPDILYHIYCIWRLWGLDLDRLLSNLPPLLSDLNSFGNEFIIIFVCYSVFISHWRCCLWCLWLKPLPLFHTVSLSPDLRSKENRSETKQIPGSVPGVKKKFIHGTEPVSTVCWAARIIRLCSF